MKPTRWLPPALLISFLVTAGCGGAAPAPQTGPKGDKVTKVTAATPVEKPTAPSNVDISDAVLATLQVASVDTLLNRSTELARPQLPKAFQPLAQATTLKMQIYRLLGQKMGIQNLERMVDTTRPAAAALVDPKVYGGHNLQPMMLALPMQDPQVLLDLIAKKTKRQDKTPAGDHVFVSGRNSVWVRIKGNYALVAGSEKVLQGAEGVLMPLVQKCPDQLLLIHVDMATVYHRFQKEIDAGLAKMRKGLKKSAKETGGMGMKMLHRWLGYVKDIKVLELKANIADNAILLTLGGEAKEGTALSGRMAKMGRGAPWGVGYLPAHSALVMAAQENPELWKEQITEAMAGVEGLVKLLAKTIKVSINPKLVRELGEMSRASIKEYTGEGAAAMWVDKRGALGFGGVNKIKDAKAARTNLVRAGKFFAKLAAELQNKTLKKQIRKLLPGFKVTVRVKKNGVRVGKHRGDVMELGIKWPHLKSKKARKLLKKVKKAVVKLVGKKLRMGWVTVGDVMVSATGKDYKKKLAEMVKAVESGKEGPMAAKVARLVGSRNMTALVYTQAEALAEQVMRAVSQVTTIPARTRTIIDKVLPGPNTEVPMMVLGYVDGNKIAWETRLSGNVVGMVARGVMAAMSTRGNAIKAP